MVHTTKAEEFLRKAVELPSFAGGAFDFISMCPPYLLVSYPELFDLLNRSSLIHPGTILFAEYPKQLYKEIPETVGGLVQVWELCLPFSLMLPYAPKSEPCGLPFPSGQEPQIRQDAHCCLRAKGFC